MGYKDFFRIAAPKALIITMLLAPLSLVAQMPAGIIDTYSPGGYGDLQEKVYLHLNHDLFLPGETVYFNAYILNGKKGGYSGLSRVVRVALHDAMGSLQDHFMVKGDSGVVKGSYTFADNLPPGSYTLTAYTRWQEGFDPFEYFQTPIRIVDQDTEPIRKAERAPVVRFYPEGGKFIAGIPVKVAFSLSGNAEEYTGGVFNEKGKQVANVLFGDNGTGQFMLKPEQGETYVFRYGTDSLMQHEAALPSSDSQGAALAYIGKKADGHSFAINVSSALAGEEGLYLLVRKSGTLLSYAPLGNLKRKGSLVKIPVESLSKGLLEAILVNSRGERLSTRWFYHESTADNVALEGLRDVYQTRETGELTVRLPEGAHFTKAFTLSISDRPLSHAKNLSLTLNGLEVTEDMASLARIKQADSEVFLLALPAGGEVRKVPSDEMADQLESYVKFTGTVTDTLGNPVRESLNVMVYSVEQDQLYTFQTKGDGSFSQPVLFNHTGNERLSYQIESDRNDLVLTFKDSIPSFEVRSTPVPIPELEVIQTLLKRKEIAETYAYFNNPLGDLDTTRVSRHTVNYKPDLSVDLDAYVRVPNLKEVIREYVPSALVRRRKGQDIISVFNPVQKGSYPKPALVFIDGIPVYDMEMALNLPMKDLKQVDVIQDPAKLFKYPEGVERGVMFVYTRGGDFSPSGDERKYVARFQGLNEVSELEVGRIEENTPQPYFLSQLAWETGVEAVGKREATFTFTTSDATGTYYVTVSGMTDDGRPFSYTDSFDVKYSPEQ